MRIRPHWLWAFLVTGMLAPSAAAQPYNPDSISILPRLTLRAEGGNGVGYSNGFIYLEGFVPIFPLQDQFVAFLDLRGVNFYNGSLWETNVGFGTRMRSEFLGDAVVGSNVFYDWRTTANSRFHQIGTGVEASWPILDLRANFYLPVGSTSTFLGTPSFSGNSLLLSTETAMTGLDVEAGVPVPFMDEWGARIYGGYYQYWNAEAPTVNGYRGRLEVQPTDNLSFHVSVQYDNVFGTTASAGIAIHLGGRSSAGVSRNPLSVLGQRVVRDPNIVVSSGSQTAVDTSGNAIVVQHVDSKAATVGDGTLARPYVTLAQVSAASSTGNIILAHAGSTFTNQNITLKSGQRFLADGTPLTITTRQGTFTMPLARPGGGPVQINNAPGAAAITLAANSEASGFTINNAAGFGIQAISIRDATIASNTINGGGADSIFLQDVQGTIRINSNTMNAPAGSGVFIIDATINPTFTTIIRNNTVVNAGADGVTVGLFNANSVASLQLVGNTFTNSTVNSINAVGSIAADNTLNMQVFGNSLNVNANLFNLNAGGAGIFNLENTLGTNTLLGGAVFNQFGPITLVPFGSLGFPAP